MGQNEKSARVKNLILPKTGQIIFFEFFDFRDIKPNFDVSKKYGRKIMPLRMA